MGRGREGSGGASACLARASRGALRARRPALFRRAPPSPSPPAPSGPLQRGVRGDQARGRAGSPRPRLGSLFVAAPLGLTAAAPVGPGRGTERGSGSVIGAGRAWSRGRWRGEATDLSCRDGAPARQPHSLLFLFLTAQLCSTLRESQMPFLNSLLNSAPRRLVRMNSNCYVDCGVHFRRRYSW